MKKALALLIVGISVSGCNFSINGNEFQKIGSTYKYISGPSLSKAGLTESWVNCLTDAFDPMNRGSRCN
tara:strand:+ start:120 stop:326 length:207 start_codon:yes stop_codon:yes gene_type:complete